jgi:hypothetical protein
MKLSWSNSLLVAPTFMSGVKIIQCERALAENFLVVKTEKSERSSLPQSKRRVYLIP